MTQKISRNEVETTICSCNYSQSNVNRFSAHVKRFKMLLLLMIIGTTKFAAFESLYMHMIELIDVGRKINRQILKIVSSLAGNHITDET